MSLKAFHLFFVAISILLALGLAAWGISDYLDAGKASSLIMGALSAVGGFALVIYGLRVRRKLAALGPEDES